MTTKIGYLGCMMKTENETATADDSAVRVLSIAGAMCGVCGDEPGDRNCADCERVRHGYVADLRAAGWAPLDEAIEAARGEYLEDLTGTPEDEAYNQAVSDVVAAIGALMEDGK